MGGLLGTVVQGFAFGTGSSIARNTVDSFMGGSGSSQEAPPQQQQQQAAAPTVCEVDKMAFVECLNANAGNVGSCDFYYQALQNCQATKM